MKDEYLIGALLGIVLCTIIIGVAIWLLVPDATYPRIVSVELFDGKMINAVEYEDGKYLEVPHKQAAGGTVDWLVDTDQSVGTFKLFGDAKYTMPKGTLNVGSGGEDGKIVIYDAAQFYDENDNLYVWADGKALLLEPGQRPKE